MLNLAAETHVDRSIDSPRPFIDTNIVGTFVLLETARRYVAELEKAVKLFEGFQEGGQIAPLQVMQVQSQLLGARNTVPELTSVVPPTALPTGSMIGGVPTVAVRPSWLFRA